MASMKEKVCGSEKQDRQVQFNAMLEKNIGESPKC